MRSCCLTLLLLPIAGCHAAGERGGSDRAGPSALARAGEPTHPELRAELLAMRDKDQQLRMRWIAEKGAEHQALGQKVTKMDAAHTARLRQIVDEHGWPGRTMVGRDGADAAWLIVQHASADVAFQRRCLELMRPLVRQDEVSAVSVAYLTDRVRMLEGRPQWYGTQFRPVDGGPEPFPIEDADQVDERRAALGLEPLAEYEARMLRSYGKSGGDETVP